jgi:hypothetical protein
LPLAIRSKTSIPPWPVDEQQIAFGIDPDGGPFAKHRVRPANDANRRDIRRLASRAKTSTLSDPVVTKISLCTGSMATLSIARASFNKPCPNSLNDPDWRFPRHLHRRGMSGSPAEGIRDHDFVVNRVVGQVVRGSAK